MAKRLEQNKSKVKAHVIECKSRTNDIVAEEEIPFSSLLLSEKVLDGLTLSGYEKPSPIQLKAIPLAKCGLDMIVQAKSGTGKTCVFTVAALESIDTDNINLQVLILAPTREIACQIHEVVQSVGSSFKNLTCSVFIGGTSINEDKKKLKSTQIAVGTPGRVKQLIELKWLNVDSVRLFILDEADKLLEEGSFQEQINWIFSTLPEHKQVLALSATYPGAMDSLLMKYMNAPVHVRLTADGLTLAGVKQFYDVVPGHHLQHVVFERKVKVLIEILSAITFQQCLVFSNYQSRAENLCHTLNEKGWPTAFISGNQAQNTRQKTMEQLKDFKCRILVSTDLISRGIDCDKINLVINLDLPWDTETYLHRVGRAGRFGAYGLAISLVTEEDEKKKLDAISKQIGLTFSLLPENMTDISEILTLMHEDTTIYETSQVASSSKCNEKDLTYPSSPNASPSEAPQITSSEPFTKKNGESLSRVEDINCAPTTISDENQLFSDFSERSFNGKAEQTHKEAVIQNSEHPLTPKSIESPSLVMSPLHELKQSTLNQIPFGETDYESVEESQSYDVNQNGIWTTENGCNNNSNSLPEITRDNLNIVDSKQSDACPFCLFGKDHPCCHTHSIDTADITDGRGEDKDGSDVCEEASPRGSDASGSNDKEMLENYLSPTTAFKRLSIDTATSISMDLSDDSSNEMSKTLTPNGCKNNKSSFNAQVDHNNFIDIVNANVAINVESDYLPYGTASAWDSGVYDCIGEETIKKSPGANCSLTSTTPAFNYSKINDMTSKEEASKRQEEPIFNRMIMDIFNAESRDNVIQPGIDFSSLDFGIFSAENVLPILSELREERESLFQEKGSRGQGRGKERLSSEVEFENAIGQFIKSSRIEDLTDDVEVAENVFRAAESESSSSSDQNTLQGKENGLDGSEHGIHYDYFSSDNEESSTSESTKCIEQTLTFEEVNRERKFVAERRKARSNLVLSCSHSDISWSDSCSCSTSFTSDFSDKEKVNKNRDTQRKILRPHSSESPRMISPTMNGDLSVPDGYKSGSEDSDQSLDQFILIPMESANANLAEVRKLKNTDGGADPQSSSLSSLSQNSKNNNREVFSSLSPRKAKPRRSKPGSKTKSNSSEQNIIYPPWVGHYSSSNRQTLPRNSNIQKVATTWGNLYLGYCSYMDAYVNWARGLRNTSPYR